MSRNLTFSKKNLGRGATTILQGTELRDQKQRRNAKTYRIKKIYKKKNTKDG